VSNSRIAMTLAFAIFVSLGIGWFLRARVTPPPSPPNEQRRSVADADEIARLRREIARLRRLRSRAGETPTLGTASTASPQSPTIEHSEHVDAATTQVGPHPVPLPVAGFANALSHTDWTLLGATLAARQDIDKRDTEIAIGGEAAEYLEETEEWLDDGIYLAAGSLGLHLGRTDYDALAHPAVVVNLMVAMLDAARRPPTPAARQHLAEIGASWSKTETDRRRAAKNSEAPYLRELMNRVEVHERFLRDAFALLDADQMEILRPLASRGRLAADLFSAAPLLLDVSGSYSTLPRIRSSLSEPIVRNMGLHQQSPEVLADLLRIANEWAETLASEEEPFTEDGDVSQLRTGFVRAVAAAEARLHERWMNDVTLDAAGRAGLREQRDLFVIVVAPPESEPR